MDLADYMRIALTDPTHGYYTHAAALGAAGDFITAPEISQMFGELIGLWIVDTWHRMGRPADVRLVELGPGRGTLMEDALRAIRSASDMPVDLYLVEINPTLRARQRERLQASWLDELADLPAGPTILIANEYVDALPIGQLVRQTDGWHRMAVGLNAGGDGLAPCPGPLCQAPDALPAALADAPDGSIAEISEDRDQFARQIAIRLCDQGGAALIIDYGPERSASGNSLQAVRAHDYADPFADPGEADLTAHVDFEALAIAARAEGADVLGPVPQAAFLNALGLPQRADSLKRAATPAQRRDIDLAAHRLTAPDQMGTLFKALAITVPGLGALAGFAP